MRSLFPISVEPPDIPAIPGLKYLPEFITPNEESQLVAGIDALPWDASWERRRQPYGGSYGRGAESVPAIPEWGRVLADRIFSAGLTERPFDHVLVNEYHPGQGIALHVDYEPFDRTVASLSLLAPCVMEFRKIANDARTSLLLERRSLLVLSDEARYEWQHGIARRKNDRWQGIVIPRQRRISITFRTRVRSA